MLGLLRMRLQLTGSALYDDELAELTRSLRQQVLSINVDDVVPEAAAPAPAGAKAVESAALGALIVSMAPSVTAAVVDVVCSWLKRQTADVEVLIDGQQLRGSLSAAQRDAIVAAYLLRVTGRAGAG
jgi:hypothetical protein